MHTWKPSPSFWQSSGKRVSKEKLPRSLLRDLVNILLYKELNSWELQSSQGALDIVYSPKSKKEKWPDLEVSDCTLLLLEHFGFDKKKRCFGNTAFLLRLGQKRYWAAPAVRRPLLYPVFPGSAQEAWLVLRSQDLKTPNVFKHPLRWFRSPKHR